MGKNDDVINTSSFLSFSGKPARLTSFVICNDEDHIHNILRNCADDPNAKVPSFVFQNLICISSEAWKGKVIELSGEDVIAELHLIQNEEIRRIVQISQQNILPQNMVKNIGDNIEYKSEVFQDTFTKNTFKKVNINLLPIYTNAEFDKKIVAGKLNRFENIFMPNEKHHY